MHGLPEALDGCKLFPCIPGSKDPATKHGWKEATADRAKLAEWAKLNPEFNWAVATGSSGLFVFDIDPNGIETWEKLVEENPAIERAVAKAFTVRTPRGGLHVYFRGEGPSTASRIADGIDTRGGITRPDGTIQSGGYALLPGSKTSDGTYTVIGGVIEPLPAELSAIIPRRKKTDTFGLEKNPAADQPRNISYAMDLINNYVKSGRVSIEGAGGNNVAYQVAASILDKAISPGLCFELLWEHWNPHCSPPWDDFELENIIRNAAQYGEDTKTGAKGFQANADRFAKFADPNAPEVKPERPRAKLQWLHEYAAAVEDPQWLIPGVLPATGTAMIYGETGSYKSFVSLDMALCLAYGVPGQWSAPPVKHDVLYFAGEGPIGTAKKRWPAWCQWQNIENPNDHRFIINGKVPFYSQQDEWAAIRDDLSEMDAKPSLIIIDTLSRLLTGLDENSTKDANMVVSWMEELARYYECLVLAIHHTGKDQSKGARGSSVFPSNIDTNIYMKKSQNGTQFQVKQHKDADTTNEIRYFNVKSIGASIVLERGEAPPEETKAVKPKASWADVDTIVKILNENGGSMSSILLYGEIAKQTGIDQRKIMAELNKRQELKWLHPDGNEWTIPGSEF